MHWEIDFNAGMNMIWTDDYDVVVAVISHALTNGIDANVKKYNY